MMKSTLSLLALMFAVACGGSTPAEETTPEPAPEPAPEPVAEVVVEAPPEPEDVHIVGDHITIDRHINFESDSDVILADSNDLLDHIAQVVGAHTEITHVRVVGHTDSEGDDAHNQELSERRAAAVVAALASRGIAITLDASGAGEAEPVCQEDTDECHAENRRVEFIIVNDAATE